MSKVLRKAVDFSAKLRRHRKQEFDGCRCLSRHPYNGSTSEFSHLLLGSSLIRARATVRDLADGRYFNGLGGVGRGMSQGRAGRTIVRRTASRRCTTAGSGGG